MHAHICFYKAEAFYHYFSSVSTVDNPWSDIPDEMQGCASTLNQIYISTPDIKDVMKNFKLNKACRSDLITHTLLNESVDILSLPSSILFNKSLSLNVSPAKWKMVNVIPIYKIKDPSNMTNYRPISLLSCLGKVFERCVFTYIFNYLRERKLISMYQSGFTPGLVIVQPINEYIFIMMCVLPWRIKQIYNLYSLISRRHSIRFGIKAYY